jgi:hypothetical protein
LTEVTVHHYETDGADPSTGERPRLAITTKRDDPLDCGPLGDARQALRGWVRPKAAPARRSDRSYAATTLWHEARGREQNAAVLNAAQSERAITIDGTATKTVMLTAAENRWTAVAVRADLTIIVAGHDVEPESLRLTPIADPAEKFGPRSPDA